MVKWEMVRLGDVCELITDGTHQTPEYCDKSIGYPFLSSKNVTKEKIDWDNIKYIPKELHETLYKRLSPQFNDILLAKNGTTGIAALVDRDCVFDIYVSLALLRPKQIINPPYLLKAINNPYTKRQFQANLKGVGVPNLHLSEIRNTKIPLPPLPIQKKIADVLDRAIILIEKRKEQIAKLDVFVKSQFVQMFGDPVTNPMGWEVKRLDEICENLDSQRIPITSGDRKTGTYPYYGASGIIDYIEDFIFDEDLLLISEDGANLLARVTPIAFSVSGQIWVNNHAHVLRFDKKATQVYLEYRINNIDISTYITGTAQPKLNQAQLNSFPTPLPPLELQNRFAAFVERVEAQKAQMKKGLALMELGYKSLMQKCFNGEMF